MTVFPLSAYLLRSLTIYRALKLSSPEVGSSKRIKDGSVISSTPMAVLFLSPPESVLCLTEPTGVSAEARRPSSDNSSSTLLSYSTSGISLSFILAANLRDYLGE